MTGPVPPRAASGVLLLADIGGYTAFLRDVATSHADDAFADGAIPVAYAMISSLLDGIVQRLVPPFTLSQLEGDAVFVYASDAGPHPRGSEVRACIDQCYADFRARMDAAHDLWVCRCDACLRIDVLDLHFVVHAGRFVIHEIAGRPELVGAEVVLAHRLLKTDAGALAGGAYAVITAAAVRDLDIPSGGALPLVAEFDHYPPTDTFVFPLRPT